jgi:crossover junction endodeoxyribonuclease RusA
MSLIVRLPWPDPSLMPNRKNGTHWTKTKAAKDAQRLAGKVCTQAALQVTGPQEWKERIPLSLLYVMPDKRHRDADNLLAASKAILDGMAEALGVDDRRFGPILLDKVAGDGEGCLIAAVGVRIESGISI